MRRLVGAHLQALMGIVRVRSEWVIAAVRGRAYHGAVGRLGRSMPRRSLMTLAVLLIAAGVAAAGFCWLADGEPQVTGRPTETSAPSPLATARPPEVSSVPDPVVVKASPVPRPIPDGYRVQLPRLRIDLPIREGDITQDVVNEQTPEHVALHFPGTYLPGDGSNAYFYAHARTGMFLSLWNARDGDEVIIVLPGGTQLRYVVTEVHPRIPPTDTRWLEPTLSERITLQTSTGPRSNDPRFIVVATPKGT